MTKSIVIVLAMALFSACAFAVDGIVLINQSTVIAAGGFPYRITAIGSYRLSGNLVAPFGHQAILVAASNVVLDLNGFNVTCSFGSSLGAPFANCIGDSGGFVSGITDVTIRNGSVTLTQTLADTSAQNIAVGFLGTTNIIAEELHILAVALAGGRSPFGLSFGANSIIRHNILSGSAGIDQTCPSLIEGNINTTGGGGSSGSGCVFVNNIGPF